MLFLFQGQPLNQPPKRRCQRSSERPQLFPTASWVQVSICWNCSFFSLPTSFRLGSMPLPHRKTFSFLLLSPCFYEEGSKILKLSHHLTVSNKTKYLLENTPHYHHFSKTRLNGEFSQDSSQRSQLIIGI